MSIHPKTCPTCNGTGTYITDEAIQKALASDEPVSPEDAACDTCGGSGEITVERMPPGVRLFLPDQEADDG